RRQKAEGKRVTRSTQQSALSSQQKRSSWYLVVSIWQKPKPEPKPNGQRPVFSHRTRPNRSSPDKRSGRPWLFLKLPAPIHSRNLNPSTPALKPSARFPTG